MRPTALLRARMMMVVSAPTKVIITGGGTGVGAAAAKMLAKGGAKITINYSRSADEANATAKECEALGGETLVCQADVSNDEDCKRLVAETLAKWGRVDGLMNNAGTTQLVSDNSLDALSADDFLHIYSVNVVGAYQMTRAVAPHMKEQGRGSDFFGCSHPPSRNGAQDLAFLVVIQFVSHRSFDEARCHAVHRHPT